MDTQYNEFRFRLHPIVLGLQLVLAGAAMAGPAPTALPTGGQVVSGQATISQPGAAQLQINQATQQATLNWQTFNIGSAAQVNFQQPNASSVALNRVLQSDASVIEGKLTANGQVFLVNPGGVIFGKTAQVDVGGLVATTMKLSDKDFANRNYHFTRDGSTASVVNNGQITAANGGYVALVAATVVNNGTITANHGTVAMAAGDGVTLQFNGGNLVNIQVDPATVKTLIQNNQLIQAPDGQVLMTAAAASALQGAVINNSGTVEANSITTTGGVIRLTGANEIDNSGTLDASGKTTGGTVQLAAASTINQSGTIDASGAAVGGSVTLAANSPLPSGGGGIINQSGIVRASSSKGSGGNVTLTASNGIANSGTTDASGATAGGSVAIQAGDAISQSGTVTADSSSGNGGSVTLTATSGIDNSGTIDASGATAGGNVTVALTPATNQTTPQADPVVAADPVLNAAPGPLVHQGGTIHADSLYGAGGQVVLAGEYLQLDNGSVTTVTGATGGGAIYAGGGLHGSPLPSQTDSVLKTESVFVNATYTRVEQGATLDASATATGNGGTIVAWGDSASRAYGTFNATGGPNGGNGGTVETSGAWLDVTGVKVDTSALLGQSGQWLLDPYNVTISTAATGGGSSNGGIWTPSASGSNVNNTDIANGLANGNVTITTTGSGTTDKGDITVNAPVSWSSNNTFSLQATNNINVNASITATGTNPSLTLSYGTGGNNGDFVNNGAAVNLPSTAKLQIGPTGSLVTYTVINSLGTANDSSTITLQGMQNGLSGHYALGSNIDASATSTWNVLGGVTAGFSPVGNSSSNFLGTFDGLGHTISGLTINRPTTDYVGLFGVSNGTLRNVGLVGSNVTGNQTVGGLVGYNYYGNIINDYSSGNVSGNQQVGGLVGSKFYGTLSNAYSSGVVSSAGDSVGGLVGSNYGNISNVYSASTVIGNGGFSVGGLVGVNYIGSISNAYSSGAVNGNNAHGVGGLVGNNGGTIINAYSTGAVSGNSYFVGGLVGANSGTITNAYSTGAVRGNAIDVGGLAGSNSGSISNTYSTGVVSGSQDVGGLVGSNTGTVTASFWDTQTSGQISSAAGTGLTTSQMMTQSSFTGWDFTSGTGSWWISDGNTRPFLLSEYSTTITNAHQLQLMAVNPSASYLMVNNINMGELQSASGLWNTTTGFVPVVNFTGLFNGGGYVISGLTINQPNIADVGLFGEASGTISNVGLVGGSVSGQYNVGGLAGVNYGSIINAYNTGTITVIGTNLRAAGLVGLNYGSITNAYSTSTVNGNGDIYSSVGGLVGYNIGSITNAYSAGTVSSNAYVGGLVGFNSGSITNAYNTGTVSGEGGLVGWNDYGGSISNAYNTGTVSGTGNVGGLVGVNHGSIANAYSTGIVNGNGAVRAGGLVGLNYGSITNAYSTGLVNGIGASQLGGLVGLSVGGTVTGSFWDTTTSGIAASTCTTPGTCGIGMATADMMNLANFTSATSANGNVNPNWDLTGTWWMSNGNTRPFLLSEYSTTITNAHQLQLMAVNLNANYTLANNINLGELQSASGLWNTATGFVPVGNATINFTGNFNGNGYTISGLTINRPSASEIGLFGFSGGTLSNVGLVGGNVTGQNDVGGLAGSNSGTITNAYSSGTVADNPSGNLGGLVGYNTGIITNAYSTGTVNGSGNSSYNGGLVGFNYRGTISNAYSTAAVTDSGGGYSGGLVGENSGTIINAYSTGAVTASGSANVVGGLVGANYGSITHAYSTGLVSGVDSSGGLVGKNYSTVNGTFWDTTTSGLATSAAGTGMSTADMQTQANFTSATNANGNVNPHWDFTNTWVMVDGHTYPYLQALTQLVSGTLIGGAAGDVIQMAQNGNSLNTADTDAGGFYYIPLPANTIPSGNTLLSYLSNSAGSPAATVRLSDGNSLVGVDLSFNTLTVGSNSTAAVSNSTVAAAKGGLISTDIPYSVSGNNITVNPGVAFTTANHTNFILNGDITTQNANLTLQSTSPIALGNNLSAGTGTIKLDASGALTYTAGILTASTVNIGSAGTTTAIGSSGVPVATVVANLNAQSSNGDIWLSNTGAANLTASATGGSVNVVNIGGNLTVPTTGSVTGNGISLTTETAVINSTVSLANSLNSQVVSTSNDIILNGPVNGGAGNVSLVSAGAISQTGGIITAGALTGSAASSATLGQSNAIANLGAFTTHGDFSLTNGNRLIITGIVDSGSTGNVTLNLNGGVGENYGVGIPKAGIVGAGLQLLGTGNFGLFAANNVGKLAIDTSGSWIGFGNQGSLTIGTVGATQGVNTHDQNLEIDAGGDISIAENLNTGTGGAILGASGGISQTNNGLITADTLLGNTGGTVTLGLANAIANLGGSLGLTAGGGLTVNDAVASGLTVTGKVQSTAGLVSITNTGGLTVAGTGSVSGNGVSLTASGASSAITLNGAVNGGVGIVTLNATAGATQNTTGIITADTLVLQGISADYALGTATNLVNHLSAPDIGSVNFNNGTSLSVDQIGGITANDVGGVTLYATGVGGNLFVRQNILATVAIAPITLQSDNDILVGQSGVSSGPQLSTVGGNILLASDVDGNQIGGISLFGASLASHGGNITLGGGDASGTGPAGGLSTVNNSIAGGNQGNIGISLGASSLDARSTTGGGNIILTGTGKQSDGTAYADGIQLVAGSAGMDVNLKTSGSGYIFIVGTGDTSSTASNNNGIELDASQGGTITISTVNNGISLLGSGGGTGNASNSNTGILLATAGIGSINISSSGTGSLSLTGKAGNESNSSNITSFGISADAHSAMNTNMGNISLEAYHSLGGTNSIISLLGTVQSAGGGNLTLTADTLNFPTPNSPSISSSGFLLLQPEAPNAPIAVGGSGGTLNLAASLFNGTNQVFKTGFDTIQIGNASGTGGITVNASTTVNDDLRLVQASGAISINAALTLGSVGAYKNLLLQTTGSGTEDTTSGGIIASGLQLLGSGGSYELGSPYNQISTLAGDMGSVDFTNNQGYAVTTVTNGKVNPISTTGIITTAGDIDLHKGATSTDGYISINAELNSGGGNIVLDASGVGGETNNGSTQGSGSVAAIVANGLILLGSGSHTLTNTGNQVSFLAGAGSAGDVTGTGTVIFTDSHTLSIGSLSHGGVSTNGLNSSGDVTLTITGGLTQSQLLEVDGTLSGSATSVNLNNPSNTIAKLGTTTTQGTFTLNDSVNLNIAGAVNSNGGAVSLYGNGVSSSSTSTVNAGGGDILVDGNSSQINLAGKLTTTSADASAVIVQNGSSAVLGKIIATGGGVVIGGNGNNDDFAGGVSQASGTAILANSLAGGAFPGRIGGSVKLNQTGNAIATLGRFNSSGAFTLYDGASLSVTGIVIGLSVDLETNGSNNGITSNGNVTANNNGTVNLIAGNGDISQSSGTITAGLLTGSATAGTGATTGQAIFNSTTNAIAQLGPFTTDGNFSLTDTNAAGLSLAGNVVSHASNGSGTVAIVNSTGALALGGYTVTSGSASSTGTTGVTLNGIGVSSAGGSTVDGGTGLVVVNGGGSGDINLAGTLQTTSSSSQAVYVYNGRQAELGTLTASNGGVLIGWANVSDFQSGVTQNADTVITTNALTGSTHGLVNLGNANAIANLGAFSTQGTGAYFTLVDNVSTGLNVTGAVTTNKLGDASITNTGALTVGGTGSVSGTNVSLTTKTSGDITLNGAVSADATAGTVTLASAGNISQNSSGTITALTLTGGTGSTGTTSAQLYSANNQIANLDAFTTHGGFLLNDTTGLNVSGAVNSGTGSVGLSANGVITEGALASITTGTGANTGLLLYGSAFDLYSNNPTNSVPLFSALSKGVGDIKFIDSRSLVVGSFSVTAGNLTWGVSPSGVTTSGTGAVILKTTTGDINGDGKGVTSARITANGSVTLDAAGGIGIAAPVYTNTTAGTGSTGTPLNLITNGTGTAGNISLVEDHTLNTSRINLGINGTSAASNRILVTLGTLAGNTFIVDGPIGTASVDLTLNAPNSNIVNPSGSGPFTVTANTLTLQAGGAIGGTDAGGGTVTGTAPIQTAAAVINAISSDAALGGTASLGGIYLLNNQTTTLTALATTFGASSGAIKVGNTTGMLTIGSGGVASQFNTVNLYDSSAATTEGITLATGSTVTGYNATLGGTAVTLSADQLFVNNSGSGAVSVNAGAQWLVYSADPTKDSFGVGSILSSGNIAQWHVSYADIPSTLLPAGNRYLFAYQPTITFTATDLQKTYGTDNTATVASDWTASGYYSGNGTGQATPANNAFVQDSSTSYSGTPNVTSLGSGAKANVIAAPGYVISVDTSPVTSANGNAFDFKNAHLLVNALPVTLTPNPVTKQYTATTDYTTTPSDLAALSQPLVGGDKVTAATITYTNPNFGIGNKTVNASNVAIGDGNNGNNYSVTLDPNTASSITKAPLAINAVTDTKVYDGTTLSLLTPQVAGLQTPAGHVDSVTLNGQSFASKNVLGANGSTLVVNSGYAVNDGNNGLNYSLTVNTAPGTITALPVILTPNPVTKQYTATTDYTTTPADLTALSQPLVGGDKVTAATIAYANPNFGIGNKTVNASNVAIGDGNNGNNYSVTLDPNTASSITKAPLAINAVTDTKVYDGTTLSLLTPQVAGLQTPAGHVDSVTLNGQSFASKNVLGANGSTLVVNSGYAVNDGNNGLNYSLTVNTAPGTITALPVILTPNPVTKQYTATTDYTTTPADLTALSQPLVGGDKVTAATIAYANPNYGIGNKTINASNVAIGDGNGGNNYSVTLDPNTASSITKAPLAINAVTDTKVYDGTTSSSLTPAVVGLQTPAGHVDSVTLNGQGFASKNVLGANGSTLVVNSGYAVNDGNNGLNYSVTLSGAIGQINPLALSISATRVYNGLTGIGGGLFAINNLIATDSLTLTGSATVDSKNIGTYTFGGASPNGLSVGSLTLGGSSADNYTLAKAAGQAVINPASLNLAAVTDTKNYDGTTQSTGVVTVTGLAASDSLSNLSQHFDLPDIGIRTLLVDPNYILNDGNGGNNYMVVLGSASGAIVGGQGNSNNAGNIAGAVEPKYGARYNNNTAGSNPFNDDQYQLSGGISPIVVVGDVVSGGDVGSGGHHNINENAPAGGCILVGNKISC